MIDERPRFKAFFVLHIAFVLIEKVFEEIEGLLDFPAFFVYTVYFLRCFMSVCFDDNCAEPVLPL